MNILSIMLWAWAGVCVFALIATAAIVLVEIRINERGPSGVEQVQYSCASPMDDPVRTAHEHAGTIRRASVEN